ncbi:hypothetical protein TNCV_4809881 [Trichonephila clavipes]|uniref:Uncharacterized protein n=1 Tax=Trichonephila clavipes TaxID=2585209 RepID=A0A8X6RRN2_TRICX|nr:hypothetical protein TNCV_4809881 [Trichonephila clavipes]
MITEYHKAQWSSGSVSRFHTTGSGSIPELGKVDSAFHPYCSGSIVAAVAEWSRYLIIVADLVKSSNPVPLKTRHVGERYTLNLSRA